MLKKTLIFVLIFASTGVFAVFSNENTNQQISEARVKAALIINFAQNVQWPNEAKLKSYLIGIVDPDSSVYKELKSAITGQRIKGKSFNVLFVTPQTYSPSVNILYFAENTEKTLTNIYSQINIEGTLIITDRTRNRVLSMINILYRTDKNTFSFEINKDNLDLGKFTVNPKILLLGGSYLNIRELYTQTFDQLRQESELIQKYKVELERISQEKEEYQSEIRQLNSKINNLSKSIKQSEAEYFTLTNKLQTRDSLLTERTKELQTKINESKLLQHLIKSQLTSINIATNKLDSLDSEITIKQQELVNKQALIENQNVEITQQSVIILKQQKRFLIAIIILLGLLLSLLFAYWAYRIKRKLNITLEKLVEERTWELQLSQKHFQNLFENSPVAMFELDMSELKSYIDSLNITDLFPGTLSSESNQLALNGLKKIKILNVNHTGLKLFGFQDKEDAFKKFHTTYNEQSLDNIKTTFLAIINKEASSKYEGIRQNMQGEMLYVLLHWLVLPGYEETYTKVLLSVSDITALKNYQKELKKHKDHLEEIVLERTEEIITLNSSLTSTNEELQQKTDELYQTIHVLNDTQDQLIQSEKMASLGMLTAGIAHEINNPINYISGSYQALQTLTDEFWDVFDEFKNVVANKYTNNLLFDIEKQKKLNTSDIHFSINFLLSNIETGINRTTEIIKSLMAFSRNESQENIEYNILEGIKNILVILKSNFFGRIDIIEEYDQNLPSIICSANGITQVLMNIISNAIDAIEEQGTIAISVKYDSTLDEIKICIKDSGNGIPQNNLDKIFDPFFTTKEVGKGTGLGLYISYNIIKSHQGTIEVDSELGSGTAFIIRLPRNRVNGNKS